MPLGAGRWSDGLAVGAHEQHEWALDRLDESRSERPEYLAPHRAMLDRAQRILAAPLSRDSTERNRPSGVASRTVATDLGCQAAVGRHAAGPDKHSRYPFPEP